LIILQTINSVFRSELLQRDKLNLCFYVNKLICWISLFFVFAKHRTFLFWSGLKLYESKGFQQGSSKAQMSRCSPIEIFPVFGYFLFILVLCRPLLQNGADMSSSMYNKSFFSWIIFGSWYLVTCLFLSISCQLWNVETAAAKWDPHVILYVQ
jgi:hypothetical protein